ncbi:acyl-ACP--UDP-N-acetylglucosamine O-acyltransferase [Thermocrinis minervae]|uniref:Acyl-[acyl-carrier-protein]--UDP-N-acetylglucosamine O-acyltransferase n=1 Tax=Thermocrinis minervae TaxID=381751 RepID=A0A1M6T1V9_9AQUI|nr:acyl-ACP--UDP-N-acetylglucosamine O-acyltransferase [Thermocrinis minervae]SHK50886.1 acyl-[acyl-carrier-protein]--UDP-N-acetylglucosamine O-acyltransferase [Thermocrinis minervae]
MAKVHPTAILMGDIELGEDVEIGPYCVLEGRIVIGSGTKIGPRVSLKGRVTIGQDCKIFDGAIIGEEPQHLRYAGEDSEVIIGNRVIIREYVTIHRGTALDKMKTIVEDDVMLMAYSHVAHDCIVRRGVIMANCATLGGHVEVGEYAFIGGLSAVHQWSRVGAYAMVGGLSGVSLDIPPYTRASGQHALLYGVNTIGLERRGFSKDVIAAIKKAYRIVFRSGMLKKDALQKVLDELGHYPEVVKFVEFIKNSRRGVARDAKA